MTIRAWVEFKESKNRAEVLRQLQDLGYELTQRTFYRHCQQGKCRVNQDGLYSRRLVKQYIEAEGIGRMGEPEEEEGPNVALSIEKLQLENEKLKISNQHAALKFNKDQGLLLDRDALYLEMAARAVALDNGFRQKMEMEASALIVAVKGELSRQMEFIDLIMQTWDELLNSFSTADEFEVLFEENEEMK